MASRNGRPKTGGRSKGTPNRTSSAVKQAILQAFEQVGGTDYLVRVAHDDPKTFVALLGRVLPKDVRAEVSSAADIGERIREGRRRVREAMEREQSH